MKRKRFVVSIIHRNRRLLGNYLEEILRDCGPLTPAGIRVVAASRHTPFVGLLLETMAECDRRKNL